MASRHRVGASLVAIFSAPAVPSPSCRPIQAIHRAFTPRRTIVTRTLRRWQAQNTTPASSSSPEENSLAPSATPAIALTTPLPTIPENDPHNWTSSYHGLSALAFTSEQAAILQAPLAPNDIEVKPDGIVYLPEIKYRRILNRAFGPGGWGLAPRGELVVTEKNTGNGGLVTREWALVAQGRLISIARGEQQYFDSEGVPTATEGCKSNALMRCCKDLGVASELWDPRFIRAFLKEWAKETVVEHVTTKKRRRHWMRVDDELRWPFKEVDNGNAAGSGSATAGAKPAAIGANPNGIAARPATAVTRPSTTGSATARSAVARPAANAVRK